MLELYYDDFDPGGDQTTPSRLESVEFPSEAAARAAAEAVIEHVGRNFDRSDLFSAYVESGPSVVTDDPQVAIDLACEMMEHYADDEE